MNLSLDQIKLITKGIINIEENEGFLFFSRFTKNQIEVYKHNPDFYMKTKATAGVRFDFITDSKNLSFDYKVERGSSRNFCYFDIYVDGIIYNHIGKDAIDNNINNVKINLPEGAKRITVYFPCLSAVYLKNISIDDDSTIQPVEYKNSFIFYGDSITQGYDSFFPSLVYAMRVADHFEADCLNQGIGAEVFDYNTLDENIPYQPSKVFVAYGTNDWSHGRLSLYEDAENYLNKLIKIHQNQDIYIITPIYRLDDMLEKKRIGNFYEMTQNLILIAKNFGIKVIKGTDISVCSNKAFSDNWLHPNEIGFELMAKGIIKAINNTESNKNAK